MSPAPESSPGAALPASARLAVVRRDMAPLAERFAAAGHRLYLVGGTVRDLVVGDAREEVDLDATTTAHPEQIKRLVRDWADAVWTQGERFGTIGAMKRVVPDGGGPPVERVFEITTHRAEAYRGDSRKPDVVFSDDIVADLSRRDFTVNAMALEMTAAEPVLVDPFGGVHDLRDRVLRTPLTPAESFSDDPLRMLRAARFVTRYGLVPVPELVEAIRQMAERLEIVSAERIRDELDKLLVTIDPAPGLRFVVETGLAGHVLAELCPNTEEPSGAVISTVAAVPAGARLARWAAVFGSVASSPDPAGVARHRLRVLRASSSDVESIGRLVGLRARWLAAPDPGSAAPLTPPASPASPVSPASAVHDWSDAEVRRLRHAAGTVWSELLVLAEAAATVDAALRPRVDALLGRVRSLAAHEDLDDLRPGLSGADVMATLGLGPGRGVGEAIEFVQAVRLDEGVRPREELERRLRDWWSTRSG